MVIELQTMQEQKFDRPKKEGRDIFSLSSEEEKKIQELVKKAKGEAQIFIHPFFGLHNFIKHDTGKKISVMEICQFCLGNKELTSRDQKFLAETMFIKANRESRVEKLRYDPENGFTPLFKDYIKELTKILSSGQSLIFLGEAGGSLKETIETMRQLGHNGEIVWYETYYALSSPGGETIRHYSDLAKKLAIFGVKKLNVGGQSNIFEGPYRLDDDYRRGRRMKTFTLKANDENSFRLQRPTMCVGEFVWNIAATGDINSVNISKATFPFSTPRQQPTTF